MAIQIKDDSNITGNISGTISGTISGIISGIISEKISENISSENISETSDITCNIDFKRKTRIRPARPAVALILFILLQVATQQGCLFKKKAKYNPEGFQNAVTLKKEALELMAKAGESYYVHRQEVFDLMSAVEKAYEASRKLKRNDSVIAAWNVMRDPKQNRLGGFMEKWRIEDKIEPETIKTMIEWVGKDFDILIKIEEEKKK
jgi:hypothetical protein